MQFAHFASWWSFKVPGVLFLMETKLSMKKKGRSSNKIKIPEFLYSP